MNHTSKPLPVEVILPTFLYLKITGSVFLLPYGISIFVYKAGILVVLIIFHLDLDHWVNLYLFNNIVTIACFVEGLASSSLWGHKKVLQL